MWLDQVTQNLGDELQANWCYFALHQQNYTGDEGWLFWQQPLENKNWQQEEYAVTLYMFWAAEAARRQGAEAFSRFHLALLAANHATEGQKKIKDLAAIKQVAQDVNLDMAQLEQDLQDPSCLERLATDHAQATNPELNIFGTPTFVFPDASPAYLKIKRLTTADEAVASWQTFYQVTTQQPYIMEIKRP